MRLVRTAVAAAQQIFADAVSAGGEKKHYVKKMLAIEGVTLPDAVVDEMIEAAVLELRVKQDWALGKQAEQASEFSVGCADDKT